ncbi:MAG: hypothetical protein R3B68_07265 [Phycisphaerales bacterium]
MNRRATHSTSRPHAASKAGRARPRVAAPARLPRLAFTLLELLVAVGASVLIALALAQLFKTTGDTVTKGRRTAYFNSYAGLLQRTLAQDFARMSRNGYMIIRNEVTNDADDVGYSGYDQIRVPLFRGQPAALQRPRRIDEIMFFAQGEFASAREAVHPLLVARSGEARIYYGHGTVSPPIDAGDPFYWKNTSQAGSPMLNPNLLAGRLGQPSVPSLPGRPGPNAFASDWILLRHVTLLSQPPTVATEFPPTGPIWGYNPLTTSARVRLEDDDLQIALLPAASELFRGKNRFVDPALYTTEYPVQGGYRRPPLLLANSGLVDIATTDLASIRAQVMQTHAGVEAIGTLPDPIFPWDTPPAGTVGGVVQPAPQLTTPRLPSAFDASFPNAQTELVYNMQAWMRNGMPTNSHGDDFLPAAVEAEAPRTRIRCAPSADNIRDILMDSGIAGSGDTFLRADAISNERMLMASNLAPGCSEFIVEWSFGETNRQTGDLIWFGSSLPIDNNNDGQIDQIAFTYYDYDNSVDPPGPTLYRDRQTGEPTRDTNQHPIDPRLIYGATYDQYTNASEPLPLVAHFGFIDPTYEPSGANQAQQLQTMPWAWPALVRVTITLTDPTDNTLERTFRFVFKTPGV